MELTWFAIIRFYIHGTYIIINIVTILHCTMEYFPIYPKIKNELDLVFFFLYKFMSFIEKNKENVYNISTTNCFFWEKGKVARMSKMLAVIVVTLLAFSALVEPPSAQAWKLIPNPRNAPLPISGHPYNRGCSAATQCRGGTPVARKLLTLVKNGTNWGFNALFIT